MKKALSILFALLLMCCAVVSVSANPSPTAPDPDNKIIIDAIPVPGEAGNTTPDINNPGKVEINSGEVITLTATPSKGYKFSHWEFIFGEFEIVEGSLTTPTITIKPTGTSNIRAEAHFVKEDVTPTPPATKPVPTLPTDPNSPPTGDNTALIINAAVIASFTAMAIAAVVIFKKKFNA